MRTVMLLMMLAGPAEAQFFAPSPDDHAFDRAYRSATESCDGQSLSSPCVSRKFPLAYIAACIDLHPERRSARQNCVRAAYPTYPIATIE